MEWESDPDGNQTRSLPEDAHDDLTTAEFYERIGEELERALASG